MQRRYLVGNYQPAPDAEIFDVMRFSFCGMSATIAEALTLAEARAKLARRLRYLRTLSNTEVCKVADLEFEATDLGEGLIGDHHGYYLIRISASLHECNECDSLIPKGERICDSCANPPYEPFGTYASNYDVDDVSDDEDTDEEDERNYDPPDPSQTLSCFI